MNSTENLLRIENLSKVYSNGDREKVVLSGININLAVGESISIAGPSGCGKTTLLLIIAGLISPSAGSLFLSGKIYSQPSNDLALVLQDYGLPPWKTVEENITLGARLQNIPVSEDELDDLKSQLKIEGIDHLYPHQLSGGMRQRAMIAQAIAANPKLIIADEPTSNLDVTLQAKILELFQSLKEKLNLSIILITHDLGVVKHVANMVAVMNQGKIVEIGTTKEILENPRDAYTQELMKAL